jgi:hypothetical protein
MTATYQPRPLNLERYASIHATHASATTSDRYGFIPTSAVVSELERAGFIPVQVNEARVRQLQRKGFQKHLLRFRHRDHLNRVGDTIPEVVIVNAHDGSSAYRIMAGVYRLVCSNGLIVGSSFADIRVRHTPRAAEDVVDASFRVIEALPSIQHGIQTMRDTALEPEERVVFARAALELRYFDQPAPVTPEQIVVPRRTDDRAGDLWTTFNVAQEHLVRGGVRIPDATTRRRTRRITGVSEDVRLNRALWTLAEGMAELKR